MPLKVCYLYPEFTGVWGDAGNVLAIRRRCSWRGLALEVYESNIGDEPGDLAGFDLIYLGGTEDRYRQVIYSDLFRRAEAIRLAVEDGTVLLAVCSGFEMLGTTFEYDAGSYAGVGVFDADTVCCGDRIVGSVVLRSELLSSPDTIVGFENHAGRTRLGVNCLPLGRVISGRGENQQAEGAVCGTAYGTHLCGPLLPRNPHLADLLIRKALKKRFGDVKLAELTDDREWQAHRQALRRAGLQPAELDVPAG